MCDIIRKCNENEGREEAEALWLQITTQKENETSNFHKFYSYFVSKLLLFLWKITTFQFPKPKIPHKIEKLTLGVEILIFIGVE